MNAIASVPRKKNSTIPNDAIERIVCLIMVQRVDSNHNARSEPRAVVIVFTSSVLCHTLLGLFAVLQRTPLFTPVMRWVDTFVQL